MARQSDMPVRDATEAEWAPFLHGNGAVLRTLLGYSPQMISGFMSVLHLNFCNDM